VVDIVGVGAGIVGASVAYHAAASGAHVVLLDASLPALGVTGASFAWIGAPGGRDAVDGSTPLRQAALEDWSRLEREVPDVQVRWTGSLAWGEDALHDLDALGPDERVVDEARLLHPASSLADLYDPLGMPADLRVAHDAVDRVVDEAFNTGVSLETGASRQAVLFRAYATLTGQEALVTV